MASVYDVRKHQPIQTWTGNLRMYIPYTGYEYFFMNGHNFDLFSNASENRNISYFRAY